MRSRCLDSRVGPFENRLLNPRFERVNPGTGLFRKNLATNPSLFDQTGWSAIGGGTGVNYTGAIITTGGPTDQLPKYFRTTKTALQTSGSSWLRVQYGPNIPVVPFRTYTFSMYGRANSPTGAALVIIAIWRNNVTTLLESVSTKRVDLGNGWYRYYVTAVAPAGVTNAAVHFGITGNSQVGDTVDGTGVLMEERADLMPFISGGMTGDLKGFSLSWEGAANASATLQKSALTEIYRNIFPNPNVFNGTYGFNFWPGATGSGNMTQVDATWSRYGKAVRATWTGASGSEIVGARVDSGFAGTTVGQVYTVEFDYVISADSDISSPGFGGGSTTGYVKLDGSPLVSAKANTVYHAWITFTLGSGTDARVLVFWPNRPADGWAEVSNVTMYSGPRNPLLTFFDGNTSPDANMVAAWVGTENASVSTLSGVPLSRWVSPGGGYANGIKHVNLEGKSSIRIIPSGSGNDSFVDLSSPPLVSGVTYTFMAKFRLSNVQTGSIRGTMPRSLMIIQDNKPWIILQGTNTTGTQILRATFTMPTTGSLQFLRLYNGATMGNADAFFEDVAIVEGVYTGPYFDGDMPNCVWRNGQPHNSSSLGYPAQLVAA